MSHYQAPIERIRFVLEDVLAPLNGHGDLDGCQGSSPTPELARHAKTLRAQSPQVRDAREALLRAKAVSAEQVLRVADDFLPVLVDTLFAWAWARLARSAPKHPDATERARQQTLSSFGVAWLLPAQQWRWDRVCRNTEALPWLTP